MTAFIALLLLTSLGQRNFDQGKQLQCQGRTIRKRYFNYAEGFSAGIPNGLTGRAGQAAGPERGFSILLSRNCRGVALIDGEANSAEWKIPSEAIKDEIESAVKDDPQAKVMRYNTRLGRLRAAGVIIHHRTTGEVTDMVVALRPGGALVYTARLWTTETRYKRDRGIFRKVLRSFRLEAWR
jgi:hypothetical protein